MIRPERPARRGVAGYWGTVALLALIPPAAAGAQAKKAGNDSCPPAVPAGADPRYGQVFIDGRPVGRPLEVKKESGEPESFEIVGPEPPELARLPVSRIDHIEYARGPEAEARYRLCAGTVAILITTKKHG